MPSVEPPLGLDGRNTLFAAGTPVHRSYRGLQRDGVAARAEDSGRKAGAVTVRSVAVHAALEEGFFNPFETVQGYLWRNQLIHGAPTRDVNETELVALARTGAMGFRVFADYLRLAERHGFESVGKLVSHLDKDSETVCDWLVQYGGQEVVDDTRRCCRRQEK